MDTLIKNMTILTLWGTYLFATGWQARISTNLANKVVLALAMSAQVDGTGLDVNVHKVVDNFTLDVILDPVYQESLPHVDHFNEGKVSTASTEQERTTQHL